MISVCSAGYEGTWAAGAGACTACPAGTVKPAAGNGACGKCVHHVTSCAIGFASLISLNQKEKMKSVMHLVLAAAKRKCESQQSTTVDYLSELSTSTGPGGAIQSVTAEEKTDVTKIKLKPFEPHAQTYISNCVFVPCGFPVEWCVCGILRRPLFRLHFGHASAQIPLNWQQYLPGQHETAEGSFCMVRSPVILISFFSADSFELGSFLQVLAAGVLGCWK